jgi:hypothetical protein
MLFSRLGAELELLESDMDKQTQISERAAPPLLSAVAFIDFAHRFGSLVDSLPLISKRRPQLKQLRIALVHVEQVRNRLQHLRGELSSNDPIEYPILGNLSWTKGNRCFMIAFGQSTEISNLFSIAFDAMNMKWVSTYQYQVEKIPISLDGVLAEMRSFYGWLTSVVTFSNAEFAALKWGDTVAVAFHLNVSANDLGTGSNNPEH